MVNGFKLESTRMDNREYSLTWGSLELGTFHFPYHNQGIQWEGFNASQAFIVPNLQAYYFGFEDRKQELMWSLLDQLVKEKETQ